MGSDTGLPGAFDVSCSARVIYQQDGIERLPELVRTFDAERVMMFTDQGLVAAGHVDRARAILEGAGVVLNVYDRVRENPPTSNVEDARDAAQRFAPELLIGFGGGSSLDVAKGCNFLLTNGGRMEDYWGYGKASRDMLPLIAVPTTAGTGSEAQSYALITQEGTHRKMACGDKKAAAKIALLDPKLTLTVPGFVTACTGLDTLVHAAESAVTRRSNAISWAFASESFALVVAHLPRVLRDGSDLEARGAMLQAATLAGFAIEASMLGAAHSMANPLTARFDLAHGQAVAMMLPYVIQYNGGDEYTALRYRDLAVRAGLCDVATEPRRAVDALVATVRDLLALTGLPATLSACSIPESAVKDLARDAKDQWTAQFNPRDIDENAFQTLYAQAL